MSRPQPFSPTPSRNERRPIDLPRRLPPRAPQHPANWPAWGASTVARHPRVPAILIAFLVVFIGPVATATVTAFPPCNQPSLCAMGPSSESSYWYFRGCPEGSGVVTGSVGNSVSCTAGGTYLTFYFTDTPAHCDFSFPDLGLHCTINAVDGLPVELMEFSVESTADADDADADTAASGDGEGGGDADG